MIRRTTIEIDDELLARAAEVLDTTGMRETVHRALDEVVRAARRRRLAERLRTGEGTDIHDPEVFAEVRRQRTF
ncbi:MAG TPA: type II toxin-antitoxin system VapB family antitoxin [Sporichthyaceae bacterium]|jgi:Arc/MetJ family transcription regulator